MTRHVRQRQVLSGGSLDDRLKDVAAAKKAVAGVDRVDFVSYADFQVGGPGRQRGVGCVAAPVVVRAKAHLLEWGLRCMITRAFDPVVFLGYQWQLARIAAEHGGTRTAYFYDVAVRQKVRARARARERAGRGTSPVHPSVRQPAPWNRARGTWRFSWSI